MYRQSNGKAESTVKSMKKIIRAVSTRNSQINLSTAPVYRNTKSLRDRLSPAQKLFGHLIQDTLPAHCQAIASRWQATAEETGKHAASRAVQAERYYNQHAKPLPEIGSRSKVAGQNTVTRLWDIYGVVTAISPHSHYFVKTASGHV